MTRVQLEKFDPKKLPRGQSRSFEVRNHTSHYGEWHFFYRSEDNDLFHIVAHQTRDCLDLKNQWILAKNRKSFLLKHKPKTFEPHPTCPCILCRPVAFVWRCRDCHNEFPEDSTELKPYKNPSGIDGHKCPICDGMLDLGPKQEVISGS